MRRTKVVLVLMALVVVAAACGQKPGVNEGTQAVAGGGGFETGAGAGGGDGSVGDDGGGVTAGDGSPDAGGTPGATGGGTDSGGSPGGGDTGAAPSGAASPPTGGGGAPPPTQAGDRTGISDTVIKIGVHAPLTGAAPVPQESFRRALPVYWEFIKEAQGGVFGKNVEVVFRDDQFDPSAAIQACRQMVEQEKVFILIGAAGGDQITACARYANSVGVPYFSPGVNEDGLAGLRGYFAISQTYNQQAPMLGQVAAKVSSAKKVALIHEDTPTFKGSRGAAADAMRQNGMEVVYNELISKGASQAEILTTSNQLRQSGADVVYFLGPPATLIPLAQQGQGQGYVPAYIGPGLSNGLNLVTAAGCPGLSNSQYLSPFPQLDVIDRFDRDFRQAYREQTGSEPDDLAVAIWGLSKAIHQFFKGAGEGMSRQSLVATLEGGQRYESNVFPPQQYSAENHFGAANAHLLRADCSSRTWKTIATFATRP